MFLLDSRIWIPLSIHESKKCDKKTKKRDVFIAGFTTWCVIQLSRFKYCTTTQRNCCGSKEDTWYSCKYQFLIIFHINKGVDHRHRKSRPGTVYHENCAFFTFWRFLAGCSRSAKIESSKKLLYGKAPSNIDFVPTPEIVTTLFLKPRDSPNTKNLTRFMIEYGLSVGSKCNSLKTNQAFKDKLGCPRAIHYLTPPPTHYVLGRCPRMKRSNVHVRSTLLLSTCNPYL